MCVCGGVTGANTLADLGAAGDLARARLAGNGLNYSSPCTYSQIGAPVSRPRFLLRGKQRNQHQDSVEGSSLAGKDVFSHLPGSWKATGSVGVFFFFLPPPKNSSLQ